MPRRFTPEELCALLEDQKFVREKQDATSHIKYTHPHAQKVPKGIRPFIILLKPKMKQRKITEVFGVPNMNRQSPHWHLGIKNLAAIW